MDIDQRQYVVTALHVCQGMVDGDDIQIFSKGSWISHSVIVVAQGSPADPNDDYIVLAFGAQVAPCYDLPLDIGDSQLGKEVWFLGFPYGMMSNLSLVAGLTMPLVKKALISGVTGSSSVEAFILDGMNNEGFSGGPVIFRRNHPAANGQSILGIISSYSAAEVDVLDSGNPTGLTVTVNTGIIHCISAQRIRSAITNNPIGFATDPIWDWTTS